VIAHIQATAEQIRAQHRSAVLRRIGNERLLWIVPGVAGPPSCGVTRGGGERGAPGHPVAREPPALCCQVQDTLDGEALVPVAVKPTVAVASGAREPSYEALVTVTAVPDWV
jgi:hypothetical protein